MPFMTSGQEMEWALFLQPRSPHGAYRQPSMTSSDNARLFSVLDLLAADSVRLCVFGDLNLPHINWDLFVYPENYLYHTAVDFISDHGLTQLVSNRTKLNIMF